MRCTRCGEEFKQRPGRGGKPKVCYNHPEVERVRARQRKQKRAKYRTERRVAASGRGCKLCGDPIEDTQKHHFCGEECRQLARAQRMNGWPIDRSPARYTECVMCRRMFCVGRRGRRVVCPSCEPNYERERQRRRNALRRGVVGSGDLVPIETLGDRDGWRCRICDGRVDRRASHPDPLSASIDHIVPLSDGGEHVWRNVQLAHLGCNMRKGDRAANDQLLLIG